MEINTVVISTDEYNLLRDFKREIEAGNMVYIYQYEYGRRVFVLDVDDTIKEQSEIIKKLRNEIISLKYPEKNKESIEDVKGMNIFQFFKWKRKNRN